MRFQRIPEVFAEGIMIMIDEIISEDGILVSHSKQSYKL